MKREIIKEFDMLGDALNTLNAQFSYRLMNLCVKAEPVSLLSVEAMIEGESQKLEKCAQIGKEDDYTFQIYPNYDGDIPALAKAIFMDHPEFKQELKTMQVDISEDESKPDMQDVHYIQVTMPEVDDNRYDVLKNGVNAFYEENKAQMEVVRATKMSRRSGRPATNRLKAVMSSATRSTTTNSRRLRMRIRNG